MSKKQDAVNSILKFVEQGKRFTVIDVVADSGVSQALANSTLTELWAVGELTREQRGRTWYYSLSRNNKQQPGGVDMLQYTIDEKFEYIAQIVQMVADGVSPSALITGRAGVGKTHLVKNVLKQQGMKENEDYMYVTGHAAAFGLYKLLHDHRDQFLIFDDCDSLFKDFKSVNVLKSALDSYDVRRVCWVSERAERCEIEQAFDFTGKIIFISNMYADRIDEAIRSRAFCMDLRLSNDEVTERMSSLLHVLEQKVPIEIKQEVLDYISTISDRFEAYGIRTLIQAIRIRNGIKTGDWRKMINAVACDRK